MPVKAQTINQRRGGKYDARPAAQARGYDAAWQRLRDAYLAEHPLCEHLVDGQPCMAPGEIVHHVEEVHVAPHRRLDWTNLKTVCRPCHGKEHRRAGAT